MDLENKKYDLEKAKEDCRRHEDALEEAQSCMCGHCHECGFDPSEMKAALDEVGRLRSDQDAIMAAWDKDAVEHDARIKELEANNKRLEAAFLDSLAARLYYEHYPGVSDAYSWHDYPEDACHCMPKEKFREKAHEALERIKEG